ncbi:MAG TPA: NAD(P)-dependent oxidoreductase, partial [Roseiflexaceae bacterium]|nr:NAD(P)-dependent oxidoreductase [Roseiflexaceae bacterium]
RFVALDELLANADIVTLHTPALPETYHLISHATLARMKPTALLINTARGDLVDEAALADALQRGLIAGAASDVFKHEPPGQSALLALDNFIATPHSAGQTEDGLRQMGEITAENALLVLAGQQPLFRVS